MKSSLCVSRLVVGLKANFSLVGPGPIGEMNSVGVFLYVYEEKRLKPKKNNLKKKA